MVDFASDKHKESFNNTVRSEFRTALAGALSNDPRGADSTLQDSVRKYVDSYKARYADWKTKILEDAQTLENEAIKAMEPGYQQGGDTSDFKATDANKVKMREGFGAAIMGGIEMLGSQVSEMFGMVWSFVKNLPMVGSFADNAAKKIMAFMDPEGAEKEDRGEGAAGAINGIANLDPVRNINFVVTDRDKRALWAKLKNADLNADVAVPAFPTQISDNVPPLPASQAKSDVEIVGVKKVSEAEAKKNNYQYVLSTKMNGKNRDFAIKYNEQTKRVQLVGMIAKSGENDNKFVAIDAPEDALTNITLPADTTESALKGEFTRRNDTDLKEKLVKVLGSIIQKDGSFASAEPVGEGSGLPSWLNGIPKETLLGAVHRA